ncbi:MAG: radical SAM protein, partial [Bacilli bacterium]|nr:radical SAM protein [Bacilli bacterium]
MKSIYDYSIESFASYFLSIGEKKFRATQMMEALYRNKVKSFEEITNINKKTIEVLKESFSFDNGLKLVKRLDSNDGTRKYLFSLNDNNLIETVLMNQSYGYSICVTSQVGCNMGCKFCASGETKKIRNLLPSEMVLQVLTVANDLESEDKRLSHVVIMGIGEPFDNYD